LSSYEESIIIPYAPTIIMRGRWAAAAVGAGVARRRSAGAMEQQAQASQAQQQQAQQTQQAQQQEIERLKAAQAKPSQPQQEDVTQKLQKLADLKQKGLLTDEEFQKLKMEALSKL
jgi:Short C-terminal domain/ATP synthase E chain